jgi:hypothetical protein
MISDAAIERLLAAILASLEPHHRAAVRQVISQNLARGRFSVEQGDEESLLAYAERVIDGYIRESDYIRQLRYDHDETAWLELTPKMECWAFHFLRALGHSAADAIRLAPQAVHAAAAALLTGNYWYDTPFDAIAITTTRNVCRAMAPPDGRSSGAVNPLEDRLLALRQLPPDSLDAQMSALLRQIAVLVAPIPNHRPDEETGKNAHIYE